MELVSRAIKPVIIGVCGRSCSGKSTAVKEIEAKCEDVLHICLDKFFKIKADNWESPEALRFDRLLHSIKKLKSGESTHIPSHRFTEIFDRLVKPHQIVLVEGYLLFVNEELNKLFDKKIFVDVSDDNILYRRIKREGNVNSIDYIKNVVIPESKKYEKLQKSKADVIIDGNNSKEEIIKEIDKYIKISINQ